MNDAIIAFERVRLEVVEELSAKACHSDKTTTRVEVFFVRRQVVCEVGDTRAENSNLHFARTCVFFVKSVFLDDSRFVDCIVF